MKNEFDGNFRISAVEIKNIALERGASACGIARAEALPEHARFSSACAGAPPGLAYLKRTPSAREDVRNWFAPARSVLVCAFQYWHSGLDYGSILESLGEPSTYLKNTGRKPRAEFMARAKSGGIKPGISRYALVPDYHEVIREKLRLMLADIKKACPEAAGKPFTDTSPVLEKELGLRAGLGFRGKNTLLISKELGSYFFIGGLALSLDFYSGESSVPEAAPGCGTCGKCASACPAGALNTSGVLDAGLCLSYWTTQSKTEAPEEILSRAGGRLYGCDICQEVCPYNDKTPDKIFLPEFNSKKSNSY